MSSELDSTILRNFVKMRMQFKQHELEGCKSMKSFDESLIISEEIEHVMEKSPSKGLDFDTQNYSAILVDDDGFEIKGFELNEDDFSEVVSEGNGSFAPTIVNDLSDISERESPLLSFSNNSCGNAAHFDDDENSILSLNSVLSMGDASDIVLSEENNSEDVCYDDLVIKNCISKGSRSDLYDGTLWSTSVIVKFVDLDNLVESEEISTDEFKATRYALFQEEVKIMRSLRNPNLMEFMGMSVQFGMNALGLSVPKRLCIITENLNVSLRSYLQNSHWTYRKAIRVAIEVASGLNWLHHKGIVIKNLNPGTIRNTDEQPFKIADFSCACIVKDSENYSSCSKFSIGHTVKEFDEAGAPAYFAPEVISGVAVSTASDVFSFGILLYELVLGEYPLEFIGSISFVRRIVEYGVPLNQESERFQSLCLPLKNLINSCLLYNFNERPGMEFVLTELKRLESSFSLGNVKEEDVPESFRGFVVEQHLRLLEAQNELEELHHLYERLESDHHKCLNLIDSQRRYKFTQALQQKLITDDREYWKKQVSGLKRQIKDSDSDSTPKTKKKSKIAIPLYHAH
jgi:serine/threonine protein kinase